MYNVNNTTNETITAAIDDTRQALAHYASALPEWDGVDRFDGQLAPLADLYADLANADDPDRARAEPVAILGWQGSAKSRLLESILPPEVGAPFETDRIPAVGTPDALYDPREAAGAVTSPIVALDWMSSRTTTAAFAAAAAHGREETVTFRAPYARTRATDRRLYALVVLAAPGSAQDARRAGFNVVRLPEKTEEVVLTREYQDQMLAQMRRRPEPQAGAAETPAELCVAKPTDEPSCFMRQLLKTVDRPLHDVVASVGFQHYGDWIEFEITEAIGEDDASGPINEIADKIEAVASRAVGRMIDAPVQMRVQAHHPRFMIDIRSFAKPADAELDD